MWTSLFHRQKISDLAGYRRAALLSLSPPSSYSQILSAMNNLLRTHRLTTSNYLAKRLLPISLFSSSTEEDLPPDFRPHRIILLRHGESQGNIDQSAYVTTAGEWCWFYDWFVNLSNDTKLTKAYTSFTNQQPNQCKTVPIKTGGYLSRMSVESRLRVRTY